MVKQAVLGMGGTILLVVAGANLFGCAPSEQTCQLNQTAIGVGLGAGAGAILGSSMSNGSTVGILSGAAIGGAVGGLIGHQGDQACKQYALQKAMELAAQQRVASQQATSHRHYQSVAWTNSNSGNHGTITPLNSYTDPASKELCMKYADAASEGDKTTTSEGRVCKQPDGTWK